MTNNSMIAIFIPSLAGGGAERFMLDLANEFSRKGKKVFFIVCSLKGEYLSELDEKVTVVDLKCKRVLFSIPGLIKFLRKEKPSALISTIYHANLVAIFSKIIARVNTKIIVRESNMHQALKNASYNQVSYKFTLTLMRLLYRLADSIIVVSKAMGEELGALINGIDHKIFLIHNFVNYEEISSLAREPVFHPWIEDKKSKIILSVGRLSSQKNWPLLLKVFAGLRRDNQVKLIILGEGPKRKEIEGMVQNLGIEDSVSLPGFKSNPYSWMSKSKIFVLSSDFEGFPNVLVQALACGCKVISSDSGSGPSEILEDGKWGRLFNIGDVNELSSMIQEALNEENDVNTTQRALFFSSDKCLEKYEALIN